MHLFDLPHDVLRLIDAHSETARVYLWRSGTRSLTVRVRAVDRCTQRELVRAVWGALLPTMAHPPLRACARATSMLEHGTAVMALLHATKVKRNALEALVRRAVPGARLTSRVGELAIAGPLHACSRATAAALRPPPAPPSHCLLLTPRAASPSAPRASGRAAGADGRSAPSPA
jgi:hypothetical protein